jgi:hypothetical protein
MKQRMIHDVLTGGASVGVVGEQENAGFLQHQGGCACVAVAGASRLSHIRRSASSRRKRLSRRRFCVKRKRCFRRLTLERKVCKQEEEGNVFGS